jgi:Rrf2 family transcriptional regulator, cysteine metabolism repressor
MQINYKTDYSLKVILHLARNYPDKLEHIKDISQQQDIPRKFLEQVLLHLKKGGFVNSKKGPDGGYFLKIAPDEITVGDVIRHVVGSVSPISCIDQDGEKTCDFSPFCVFRGIFSDVKIAIANIIDSKNFKDLLREEQKLRQKNVLDFQI